MAILGALIKGLINFQEVVTSETNPGRDQEKVLKNLLEKAKNTKFGKHYGFKELLKSNNPTELFSEKIPYFDYNKMQNEWWYKLQEDQKNVSWPGKPPYFALSSGTTGSFSKKIPVSDEMVEAIRNTGIKQVASLSNYNLPSNFFEKEIMMLGSSTNLQKVENHHEGEISGISASNIPFWFRGFYKPGQEIAEIENWDDRILEIAKKAKTWDIGAITGIPAWIELMMKKVIEYHNAKNIHEIWPNFQVYSSGGVAFETYEKSFNQLLAHPITVIDTYLASEGFLAFQSRPETSAMKLVTDNGVYFEFVPFKTKYINNDGSLKPHAPTISLENIEKGEEYVLVISTVSGLWRYIIGDTVEFTDFERLEIKITGRTKFFLNTVGEQLSVNKMNQAVQELEKKFHINIPEFTLAALNQKEGFVHKWFLGVEGKANNKDLAQTLDNYLMANKSYASAREKALEGVEVVTLPLDVFYEWNAKKKKKGGQVKMEKVLSEEKLKDWEIFVKEQSTKSNSGT